MTATKKVTASGVQPGTVESITPERKTDMSNATSTTYPESVYAHTGTEPIELADGSFAPPFTRELAEKIAATKPDFADWEGSDIGAFAIEQDELLIIWGTAQIGAVDIVQETFYDVEGNLLRSNAPHIQVWGGDPGAYPSPVGARLVAIEMLENAEVLQGIITPNPVKLVRNHEEALRPGDEDEPFPWRTAWADSAISETRQCVTLYDEGHQDAGNGPLIYVGKPKEDMTITEAESFIIEIAHLISIARHIEKTN